MLNKIFICLFIVLVSTILSIEGQTDDKFAEYCAKLKANGGKIDFTLDIPNNGSNHLCYIFIKRHYFEVEFKPFDEAQRFLGKKTKFHAVDNEGTSGAPGVFQLKTGKAHELKPEVPEITLAFSARKGDASEEWTENLIALMKSDWKGMAVFENDKSKGLPDIGISSVAGTGLDDNFKPQVAYNPFGHTGQNDVVFVRQWHEKNVLKKQIEVKALKGVNAMDKGNQSALPVAIGILADKHFLRGLFGVLAKKADKTKDKFNSTIALIEECLDTEPSDNCKVVIYKWCITTDDYKDPTQSPLYCKEPKIFYDCKPSSGDSLDGQNTDNGNTNSTNDGKGGGKGKGDGKGKGSNWLWILIVVVIIIIIIVVICLICCAKKGDKKDEPSASSSGAPAVRSDVESGLSTSSALSTSPSLRSKMGSDGNKSKIGSEVSKEKSDLKQKSSAVKKH